MPQLGSNSVKKKKAFSFLFVCLGGAFKGPKNILWPVLCWSWNTLDGSKWSTSYSDSDLIHDLMLMVFNVKYLT